VDVNNFLVARDVHHEVISVRGRLRSAERIASVLGLPPGQVGKVVVYETDRGPVAAVTASDREPDEARVARSVRADEARPANPPRASQLTEYLAEAIPPVALPDGFTTVVDRPLARQDVLYFAGGEATSILKLRGRDLVRATDARVTSISS
jgi:prolyl-tRNA editing enzyme YbaK/EbsC (Cys-tRNA(Pro) deacylase)